ncbi:MAG: iron-sulfur cluster assembly accessory protein [Rhabdochlamydiaceae bacterium]|nr:iron-sulfur cluster assembly accessory protein [Candidatus Amphrikana amoebophyrae]
MTKRAAEKFIKILKEEGKEGWCLSFGDKPGGCSGYEYVLDFSKEPKENDKVFHSYGVDVVVDKSMVERLLGTEIDYLDGLNGSGFKVTNPNAKSSCSCGNSQGY